MSERASSYRVVLEADLDSLPPDVQIVVMEALVSGLAGIRSWDLVPGLLCVVSSVIESPDTPMSWSCWSRIHGFFNADLTTFEREFLPFVLDRAETCAVRVRRKGDQLERWMWWPGSSVEDVFLNLSAALVMET